jgi:hypothetical protein
METPSTSKPLGTISAKEHVEPGWTDVDSTSRALCRETDEVEKAVGWIHCDHNMVGQCETEALHQSITDLKKEVVKCNTVISDLQSAVDIQKKDLENSLNQSISNLKEEVVKQNSLISDLKAVIEIQSKDQKIR